MARGTVFLLVCLASVLLLVSGAHTAGGKNGGGGGRTAGGKNETKLNGTARAKVSKGSGVGKSTTCAYYGNYNQNPFFGKGLTVKLPPAMFKGQCGACLKVACVGDKTQCRGKSNVIVRVVGASKSTSITLSKKAWEKIVTIKAAKFNKTASKKNDTSSNNDSSTSKIVKAMKVNKTASRNGTSSSGARRSALSTSNIVTSGNKTASKNGTSSNSLGNRTRSSNITRSRNVKAAAHTMSIRYTRTNCVSTVGSAVRVRKDATDKDFKIQMVGLAGPGSLKRVEMSADGKAWTDLTRAGSTAVWELKGGNAGKVMGDKKKAKSVRLTAANTKEVLILTNVIPADWKPAHLYMSKANFKKGIKKEPGAKKGKATDA